MIVEDNIVLKKYTKELAPSEVKRGYIFITKDVQLQKCYSNGVYVFVDTIPFGIKKLDASGRIHIKKATDLIGEKKYEIELSSKYVIITLQRFV